MRGRRLWALLVALTLHAHALAADAEAPCNGHGIPGGRYILRRGGKGNQGNIQVSVDVAGVQVRPGRQTDCGCKAIGDAMRLRIQAWDWDPHDCQVPTTPELNYIQATTVIIEVFIEGFAGKIDTVKIVPTPGDQKLRVWSADWQVPAQATPEGHGSAVLLSGRRLVFKLTGTVNDVKCTAPKHAGSDDPSKNLAEYSARVTIPWIGNLRFEKGRELKDWICAHTCKEAWSVAVADVSPSGLAVTYSIQGNARGASIDASSGKITHDGSHDGGTIKIRAAVTNLPTCFVERDFTIRAHPVEITGTALEVPYSRFDVRRYGLGKKHTWSSSTGDVADLEGIHIGEYIRYTRNDSGRLPSNVDPDSDTGWYLDATGTMRDYDWHIEHMAIWDINDFWPDRFPAIIEGTQQYAWQCEDCRRYVDCDRVIIHRGSLIRLSALPSGVISFKFTMINDSPNNHADCSSDNVNYEKNGVSTAPPQYYVGNPLALGRSYNLSVAPSAATVTPGAQLSVRMSGMVGATETEVNNGARKVTFLLIDDDLDGDDTLWTIKDENIFSAANGGVPAGATGRGSVIVPFSVGKANALNQRFSGRIIGPDDTSGETEAEIAFEIDAPGRNPQSPAATVRASRYAPPAPRVAPNPVPLGRAATVTMSGCTEATVTSGDMTMTLHVIDDDSSLDDVLVKNIEHTFAVPAGWIRNGLVPFPSKEALIANDNGVIKGASGSSGEGAPGDPAEVAFEIEVRGANPRSSTTPVTAEQP